MDEEILPSSQQQEHDLDRAIDNLLKISNSILSRIAWNKFEWHGSKLIHAS